ncbi:MAG: FprA family A-type flavoprotein [Candidatus Omnitrophica bacterium]|nr:FprA family A-type flavoprotein [Candidatus Omnitrophota bacterium]
MKEIAKDIYWAGYIDWDLRNFHGYSTPSGSTYNAYLIKDEKPALIDTVKYYGFDEMLSRIRDVIDPAKIAYIISNHTEMDHSGAIDKLLEFCPNAEVVCSPKGEEGLKRHFLSGSRQGKKEWKFKVVQNAEELKIGKKTLKFFHMPMVHWPDSMATYCKEENILFPNDAFGQHFASSERYVDEVGIETAAREAQKYYANIVMPYGNQVVKALDALKSIKIDMICPSHGLIWRKEEDIKRIAGLYAKWANYESDKRAVIIYDSMWHSTEKIAQGLYMYLEKENVPVKLINLKVGDFSEAITEVMKSNMVLIGSAILNNRILPSVGGFLTYLKGLKPKNRFGFTFGSYGWAKSGFKELEDALKEAGINLISEGRYVQYMPDDDELAKLKETVLLIKKTLDL